MKKVNYLLAVLFVPTICWLIGSFIAAEINPFVWEGPERFLLILFTIVVLLYTVLFIKENT